ncbi:predicted protein [Chaetomium globosum CBS 148.51]|uniref:Uncharacterized protein n=1 Tax=Chaetomium globosum (strain ATCC 6205 / CBS 148.51 / DSM 1962 / NBRC 6347 / NRRL 1970) TaxID=306901 RepID=Q2H1W9_CHAGB|nr:uncharacterized protein CHGG_04227 [Chaetomium globosum CBS 148.51]EAQ87608.1 predicted protein [Chaetomium globosum CBS 148.51]
MRIDLASGNCTAVYDEPQTSKKDPTAPSKVPVTKNENPVDLDKPLEMPAKHKTVKTTRADETVASATNNKAGNPGGDREVAKTTTAGNTSEKNNEKPVREGDVFFRRLTRALPRSSRKTRPGLTHSTRRSQMRALLENDATNHPLFREMLARSCCPQHTVSSANAGPFGPICGNPVCGAFGHTLAVCPIPTTLDGDMSGCFFCNVVDHDADDCAMMEWVSPATLVTHLITNRAGMPPWNTRIDWVTLAIGEWDIGVSPITDPLFERADLKSLKALAKPELGGLHSRPPLMEASRSLCYCRHGCLDGLEHVIFKNKAIRKYIAEVKVTYKVKGPLLSDRERVLAVCQAQMAKKTPKQVTKERKGRRAMKKEAMAATASEKHPTSPNEPKDQAVKEHSAPSEAENPVPLSQRLMELADTVGDVLENIQKTMKS